MTVDRVKFQEIVSSQLPQYVREDFPLLTDFLEQYYVSQEYESGPVDLINNIDQYVKVENLTNLVTETTLTKSIDFTDTNIEVKNTVGFSENNGIIQIDNEIIFPLVPPMNALLQSRPLMSTQKVLKSKI